MESKPLVPRLRFPEFRDALEWELKPLRDVTDHLTEKVRDRQLIPVSISAGTGFVSQSEKFGRDISGAQYRNYIHLRQGDFSYNKGNSKRYPQGCVYELKEFEEAAVPSAFVSFRFRRDFVNEFFKPQFEQNSHGRELRKFITSGARSDGLLNVSPAEFFSVQLPVPHDRAEQQKIAECLTSLDELIAAEGRKLEALCTYKKGLMQNLFPREGETSPRLRFPEFQDAGEWCASTVGEQAVLVSGFPFDGGEILEDSKGVPLMRGINITEGMIRHNQDIDRYFLGPTDKLEKYVLRENDLVIGMDGSKVGKNSALISKRDVGALLVQRVARLRTEDPTTNVFMSQIINSPRFHSYVDRINTSSGIPHISAKQIDDFQVNLPQVDEQERIAGCLTSLDALVTAQGKKLETLKIHKQGLMQGLFPSTED